MSAASQLQAPCGATTATRTGFPSPTSESRGFLPRLGLQAEAEIGWLLLEDAAAGGRPDAGRNQSCHFTFRKGAGMSSLLSCVAMKPRTLPR